MHTVPKNYSTDYLLVIKGLGILTRERSSEHQLNQVIKFSLNATLDLLKRSSEFLLAAFNLKLITRKPAVG